MKKQLSLSEDIFNPDIIMNSGQVFRMTREEEYYRCLSGDNEIMFYRLPESRESFEFFCEDDQWDFWWSYFDLDTDYGLYNRTIENSNDAFLRSALEYARGMRILKQDLWEIFVSYLISQNNNIPKIKKSIHILCDRYSNGVAFPKPDILATIPVSELSNGTALGYRAEYISELSQNVSNGKIYLDDFIGHSYTETVAKLTALKGVGPKVANCIALYGLHVMDSYPIDTWMKKIISEDYDSYKDINSYMEYINSTYPGYQGYVQQLQFYYKRK